MTDNDWAAELRLDIARNLTDLETLYGSLHDEAVHRADDPEFPGGVAMVLLGPGADLEAWGYYQLSAIFGRLSLSDRAIAAITATDSIQPPLAFLASWSDRIRDARDQEPSGERATITREITYIRSALDWMTALNDEGGPWWLPVDDFATELARVRTALEDALRAGFRPEFGAPCLHCRQPLERLQDKRHGLTDNYRCRACGREYGKTQYDYAVGVTYLHHAPALTADQIEEREGIPATRVRVWGSRYEGLKRGKNPEGLLMYDVEAVLTKRAEIDGEGAA